MVKLKRVVLDVLKPHQPDALEFCRDIASLQEGYEVRLSVQEMDEDTQTLQLEISAANIDLGPIENTIKRLGASIHSIDLVEVKNEAGEG